MCVATCISQGSGKLVLQDINFATGVGLQLLFAHWQLETLTKPKILKRYSLYMAVANSRHDQVRIPAKGTLANDNFSSEYVSPGIQGLM